MKKKKRTKRMCGTASRSFLNDVGPYFVLRCYSKINTDWREADRQTYQTINDHIFLSLSLSQGTAKTQSNTELQIERVRVQGRKRSMLKEQSASLSFKFHPSRWASSRTGYENFAIWIHYVASSSICSNNDDVFSPFARTHFPLDVD